MQHFLLPMDMDKGRVRRISQVKTLVPIGNHSGKCHTIKPGLRKNSVSWQRVRSEVRAKKLLEVETWKDFQKFFIVA